MLKIRRSGDRGHANHGWLDTRHTFSFGSYHDPEQLGFRTLRVINEDVVEPGRGFGTHPHENMEILTYVLDGAVEHRDSMGNGSQIRAGDLQRMTAGTGVTHSEFNPSSADALHLYQIWIVPAVSGLEPSYEQSALDPAERRGRLRLLASDDGREGSLRIHQDVALYGALLDPEESVEHGLAAGRHAWVQVARGALELDGERLSAGDGAAISDAELIRLAATEPAELFLFDLA